MPEPLNQRFTLLCMLVGQRLPDTLLRVETEDVPSGGILLSAKTGDRWCCIDVYVSRSELILTSRGQLWRAPMPYPDTIRRAADKCAEWMK